MSDTPIKMMEARISGLRNEMVMKTSERQGLSVKLAKIDAEIEAIKTKIYNFEKAIKAIERY